MKVRSINVGNRERSNVGGCMGGGGDGGEDKDLPRDFCSHDAAGCGPRMSTSRMDPGGEGDGDAGSGEVMEQGTRPQLASKGSLEVALLDGSGGDGKVAVVVVELRNGYGMRDTGEGGDVEHCSVGNMGVVAEALLSWLLEVVKLS